MSEWQEAGSAAGEVWKPETPGDSITGILKFVKSDVGMNKSKIYQLTVDGKDEPVSVWGSTVLDTKFEEIPLGSAVKIEYLGKEKGNSPMPYKNFRVLYKPNPVAELFPDSEIVG